MHIAHRLLVNDIHEDDTMPVNAGDRSHRRHQDFHSKYRDVITSEDESFEGNSV